MIAQERRRWLAHWLLSLVCGGVLVAAAWTSLEPWDLRWRDRWFRDSNRDVQLSPALRLVLIDDKSLTRLKAPTAFWAVHLSQAASALLEAGATVVGVDYLPYDMDAGCGGLSAPGTAVSRAESRRGKPLAAAL